MRPPYLTASQLKLAAMNYAVRTWDAEIVIDECNGGMYDVLAILKDRKTIDIEVKISISDLKHDLIKPKHLGYQSGYGEANYFVFAVTEEISKSATEFIRQEVPYAGLIMTLERYWLFGKNMYVSDMKTVIRRKLIHNRLLDDKDYKRYIENIARRYVHLFAKIHGISE